MFDKNFVQWSMHAGGSIGDEFGSATQVRSLWRSRANRLFQEACRRRFWRQIRDQLTGRVRRLYDLNQLGDPPCHQHYAGLRTVRLADIQGSEGRTHDFDRGFYPLDDRMRARWTNVALAALQGTGLPPVELIQVGDIYFVRDGHHRVSVAAACEQEYIDAEVTVWEVPRQRFAEQPVRNPWRGLAQLIGSRLSALLPRTLLPG